MSEAVAAGRDDPERCAACDEELDVESGPVFAVGAEAMLCFACAVARGGRWDAAKRRWVADPDYADLGEGFD